jgi:hypothetical protein
VATSTRAESVADETPARPASTAPRRPPGFRFSAGDALVLLVGAVSTWLTWGVLGEMALLLPVVLFHFFLFCNVFRIRRSYELVWAGAFVLNLLAWQAAGAFPWRNVLVAQAPLTLLLILAETRSDRYHGIGSGWISRQAGPSREGVGHE